MQTFLPYPDFKESAESIDHFNAGRFSRKWKQTVESKQLLCAIHFESVPDDWKQSKDWISRRVLNHPACQMWVGYEEHLAHYYNVFLEECITVNRVNTKLQKIDLSSYDLESNIPWWLGDKNFHRAMRSRLLQKSPAFYENLFSSNDVGFNDSRYLWPVNSTKTFKMI